MERFGYGLEHAFELGGSVPGSGDTALFNAASYNNQPSLSTPASVGGIWGTGGGTVTIDGNALALYGTTINSNAGTGIELDSGGGSLTINAPLVLQNDQQWINNSGNPLTVNSDISGPGGLTKLGTGMLTLTGMNAFGGDLTVSAGTIRMPCGTMSVYSQYVGLSGTGAFLQSGGTNSAWDVQLGINPGDSGTYCLSGSGLLSVGYFMSIGGNGTGVFTQSGGTNSVGTWLYEDGSYNLSGSGMLLGGDESVYGCFTQTGGTNSGSLDLGPGGTYKLSGNGLLSTDQEIVGDSGTSNFTQSGGINTAGSEYIGLFGTGSYKQCGGINAITSTLWVGYRGGGTYCLSGSGRLSASIEYIANDNSGCLMQSGGTNTVAAGLFVGNSSASGSYSLSGSSLLSAFTEQIGSSDSIFQQTGGTNTAAFIDVGSGYYLLGGGLLQVNGGLHTGDGTLDGGGGSAAIVAGSGSIVDLTGVVNAASMSLSVGSNSLLIVPQGFDPTSLPHYTNLGLTHTAGTTLYVSAGTGFGGWGTIADPVNCQGSITASPSGWINLTNGLTLSGTGQVNLGSGTLTVNDPNSNISSGSLMADTLAVGLSGTGSIAQSGGAATLASSVFLGYGMGDIGAYNLSGSGQLFSGNSYIGYSGSGSFTQSGGTHAVSSALYLGYNTSGSGTYCLGGSGLLTANTEYLGYNGTGTFTQSGGANLVASNLIAWSGTYSLCGSGSLSAVNENIDACFRQSGGTNTIYLYNLHIGTYGGSGTYALCGSGLLFANAETIGDNYSNGIFMQSGGTHTVGSSLLIGGDSGFGTYELCGSGLLSVSSEEIGGTIGGGFYSGISPGTGSFQQSGGTHSVGDLALGVFFGSGSYSLSNGFLMADTEEIGEEGSGAFTQSGGTHTVTTELDLGNAPTGGIFVGVGSYQLSGGLLLAASNEYIGLYGIGSFMQSGGTHAVSSSLYLGYGPGSSGSYCLCGSGLLTAGTEYVGYSGSGSFTQSGGTNTATLVDINGGYYRLGGGLLQLPVGGGTLDVSNGGLQTAGGSIDCGGGSALILADSSLVDLTAKLRNAASTSLAIGADSLLIVPPGFNPSAFQTFSSLGLTHTLGTTLNVSAGTGFGGWGTITDLVTCQGTITATPGGWINLTNGLTLSGTGQVNLGSGTLTVNDPNSGVSGGSFTADTLIVGLSATGSFTQPGGSATLASTLLLGENAGSSGTYNLNGGRLVLGTSGLLQGFGAATFNFGGGTLGASAPWATSLNINLTGTGGNATVDATGGSISLSGVLSGSGGLALTGSGTLTLSNSGNTYSGPTAINAGTLLAGAAALSPNSAVTVNGGVLDVTAGSQTVKTITVGGAGTLNLCLGNLLVSNGAAHFNSGSSLNISGTYAALPELLMTYTGLASGTFSNVNLNGTSLPYLGDSLAYSSGSLELVSDATWNQAAGGSWTNAGNWLPTTVPASGSPLLFPELGANSSIAVMLDGPQSASALVFSASEGYSLSQGSGGALTLGTSAAGPLISVLSGTHTISAPLVIVGGGLSVSLLDDGGLEFSGNVSDDGNGRSLTLTGDGSGQLILSGTNSYSGGTDVQSGTLIVESSTALPTGSSLIVGVGASQLFGDSLQAAPIAGEVQAVPEPGTMVLLLAGGALWAMFRKRR